MRPYAGSGKGAMRCHGSGLPQDLAELFSAQRLDARALLVPGTASEEFTLPDGAIVTTSFRYFPDKLMVENLHETFDALLIAIEPRSYGRVFVAKDGSFKTVYSEASQRKIDEFGK